MILLGGFAITTTREATAAGRTGVLEFAMRAAEMAANTRCDNVVLLDLRSRSPVTEYFIIATGTSPRQMRTVVDEVRDLGKRMGFTPWKMDGYESAKWIVLDCVNVVVHVFDTDSRDFYDLELLWGDCPQIDWRKALGLPPAQEEEARRRAERTGGRFAEASGRDEMEAEEEDARLDGRDVDDEEGDADIDEDADEDNPVVIELPDMSTGSNSVEFVEIDPPSKRRQRGRAVYPTPIRNVDDDDEEEISERRRGKAGSADESRDEDERERNAEAAADGDVEGVSKEDLSRGRIKSRPMGGVSANLSSTSIEGDDEEDQLGDEDGTDAEQDHRDEIPEAHERAAEAVRLGNVELTTEEPGDRPRRKALRTRADMAKPVQAAPGGVNVKKAKAGVVKGKARKGGESGVVDAPVAARGKKPVVKMSKVSAKKAGGRKVAEKKVAPKKAAVKKSVAKKGAPKKGAVKKAAPKKAAPKKAAPKKAVAKKGGGKKGK